MKVVWARARTFSVKTPPCMPGASSGANVDMTARAIDSWKSHPVQREPERSHRGRGGKVMGKGVVHLPDCSRSFPLCCGRHLFA